MDSKVHAEKAIRGINGKTVRPGLVKEEEDADGDVKMDGTASSSLGEGKVVAVDFALPKDAWEARQTGTGKEEMEVKSEDEEDGDEDSDAAMEEADESQDDSQEAESDNDDDDDEDMESDDEEPSARTEPEEGSTLFIRNLAFEATDEDLHGV